MDAVDRLIKIWYDSIVELGQALEDFINNLPAERARFWGIDLWLWRQHQRDLGMKVDYASYQRLRAMLDQFRDQFLAQGVPMLSAYVPSAEQTARELAGIRARNNRPGQPSAAARAAAFAAEPTAPAQAQPPSTSPAPTAPSALGPSATATPPAPPAGTTTTPLPSGSVTVTRPQHSATKEPEAPSKPPVGNDARSGGTFSDPAYGTREWFDFLVRTRESYQFREGFRIGMPEASIRESVDKRVRQNSPAMFDRAWKLANELLSSKKVEDKDTAIRIAAILTYQKYYPPDAVADAQPGGETRAEIAVADYKARQILAGQGPVSRFFEALLLPASVNPQPLNLDNLLVIAAGVAGATTTIRGAIKAAQKTGTAPRNGTVSKKNDPRKNAEPKPTAGETEATAIGRTVHKNIADARRASGEFDLVQSSITDKNGNPILVSKKVDLKTGVPLDGAPVGKSVPDAVSFRRDLIIDDKPLGRPIAKDRQAVIRYIRAYEEREGHLPSVIAIGRYDPKTGKPVLTEIYSPKDFLP